MVNLKGKEVLIPIILKNFSSIITERTSFGQTAGLLGEYLDSDSYFFYNLHIQTPSNDPRFNIGSLLVYRVNVNNLPVSFNVPQEEGALLVFYEENGLTKIGYWYNNTIYPINKKDRVSIGVCISFKNSVPNAYSLILDFNRIYAFSIALNYNDNIIKVPLKYNTIDVSNEECIIVAQGKISDTNNINPVHLYIYKKIDITDIPKPYLIISQKIIGIKAYNQAIVFSCELDTNNIYKSLIY